MRTRHKLPKKWRGEREKEARVEKWGGRWWGIAEVKLVTRNRVELSEGITIFSITTASAFLNQAHNQIKRGINSGEPYQFTLPIPSSFSRSVTDWTTAEKVITCATSIELTWLLDLEAFTYQAIKDAFKCGNLTISSPQYIPRCGYKDPQHCSAPLGKANLTSTKEAGRIDN